MATILELLDEGVAMVHCDPRRDGVILPSHLKEDAIVRLNFAYGFQLPSFVVDDEAVSAVLNFNGHKYHCIVPWDAVFAVTAPEHDHRGWFWRASAPPEALLEFFTDKDDDESIADEVQQKRTMSLGSRPNLRIVETGEGEAEDEEIPLQPVRDSEITDEEPPPSAPKLRLVK